MFLAGTRLQEFLTRNQISLGRGAGFGWAQHADLQGIGQMRQGNAGNPTIEGIATAELCLRQHPPLFRLEHALGIESGEKCVLIIFVLG